VIVVDDGSTEPAPDWLRQLERSGRLRYHRNPRSLGPAAARNWAIRAATGDLVTGIDDDDIWLPRRLSTLVAALDDQVSFVCASDIAIMDGRIAHIWRRPPHIDLRSLLTWNIVGNQVLVRRELLQRVGGFDESLNSAEDFDLWVRLVVTAGPARGVRTPLQVKTATGAAGRISTNPSRARGYWAVYRRYRARMSPEQRREHLFNLRSDRGKPTSLKAAQVLSTPNNKRAVLIQMLRERIPGFAELYQRAVSRYFRGEVRRELAGLRALDSNEHEAA
jgi:glycosyltransferase involved in cell wall biosynthesis